MDDDALALFQHLIELPDPGERSRLLRRRAASLEPADVEALGERLRMHAADRFHESAASCGEFAALIMELGELTAAPCVRATGLRLEAFVEMAQTGDMARALRRFDEAAAIHLEQGDELGWALLQPVRLVPLSELGRMDEALATVRRASAILEAHGEPRARAILLGNLAFRLHRAQRYPEALAAIDESLQLLESAGASARSAVPNALMMKGVILVSLGRTREAIPTLLDALERAEQLGQSWLQAQIVANLGRARSAVGLFARALAAYEHAREIFKADGATLDEALTRLLISECLIHLKRYESAILHARGAHDALAAADHRGQAGQALIIEGQALLGLGRTDESLVAFRRAQAIFEQTGDTMWLAEARLQAALAIRKAGKLEEALAIAEESAAVLEAAGAALECAQARLLAAAVSHALGRSKRAAALVKEVIAFAVDEGIDHLACDAFGLQADFAAAAGDSKAALAASLSAIGALERAQGQVVAEHRADFLGGRERAYERVVDMHLEIGDVETALAFVDRAKSRALVALVEGSGGISAPEPSDADRRDHEAIEALVLERARLVEGAGRDDGTPADPRAVRRIEREIGALREQRTFRHMDFADGGDVWSLDGGEAATPVPDGAAVLEYYGVDGRFVGFARTGEGVVARRLDVDDAAVQALLRALRLNFVAAPHASERHIAVLEAGARSILSRLHTGLVAPFGDRLAGVSRLFVVPHGRLHYVPFHALHDGRSYLAADHEVSYLPSARTLTARGPDPDPDAGPSSGLGLGLGPGAGAGAGAGVGVGSSGRGRAVSVLAVGNACGGRLPHAVEEARAVAALWGEAGTILAAESATRSSVRAGMGDAEIVHIAAHGRYDAESPLFSGIRLGDGDLTALDIFETRLGASLVTLSACESALSTIGGGDEIQGMIRAFLTAGARSIVASLWMIEDACGADFMLRFYSSLRAGTPKGAALTSIYREFIADEVASGDGKIARRYVHPFYWAPYLLIGDPGTL